MWHGRGHSTNQFNRFLDKLQNKVIFALHDCREFGGHVFLETTCPPAHGVGGRRFRNIGSKNVYTEEESVEDLSYNGIFGEVDPIVSANKFDVMKAQDQFMVAYLNVISEVGTGEIKGEMIGRFPLSYLTAQSLVCDLATVMSVHQGD